MKTLKSFADTRTTRQSLNQSAKSVGFVPTMGALHEGHLKLVETAKNNCDVVFVSIFVNPTQFNDPKDLEKYPRTIEADSKLLEAVGCDYLFYPTTNEIYPDSYKYKITEVDFSKTLCGEHRPGHFDGVLTVVAKLFNIVQPDKAFFGEKDYQQLQLIKGMVAALFMPLEVVGVPTVREADGLAMSSRNVRLSPSDREKAPAIFQTLKSAASDFEAKDRLKSLGFDVEYVQTIEKRRFAAVNLGNVRLIDNVELST